jgi:hypothetical protein
MLTRSKSDSELEKGCIRVASFNLKPLFDKLYQEKWTAPAVPIAALPAANERGGGGGGGGAPSAAGLSLACFGCSRLPLEMGDEREKHPVCATCVRLNLPTTHWCGKNCPGSLDARERHDKHHDTVQRSRILDINVSSDATLSLSISVERFESSPSTWFQGNQVRFEREFSGCGELQLGKGQQGKVVLVRNPTTRRLMALKTVRLQPCCLRPPKEDYAEVAALQRLAGHPHVVMLFGAWIHGSQLNMLMEYCNGSLSDVIKAKKAEGIASGLSEASVFNAVAQVASGLSELRRIGFNHRDIKPANLLLTLEGHIKLADFGLTARISSSIEIDTPAYMAPDGNTPAYMAPEMFHGECGPTVDVWALGVVAFELLTLERLFRGRCVPYSYHIPV